MTLPRSILLFRVLSASAARRAFEEGLGLYLGLALFCAWISAGNGLRATDVVRAMDDLPAVKVLLWSAWVLAATPITRALLTSPSTWYLRPLPVAREAFVGTHLVHLALAESPWIVLFWRGRGPVAGLVAFTIASAIHAALAVRPSGWRERFGLVVCAGLVLAPLPDLARLTVAAPVCWYAISLAFDRAPERAGHGSGATLRGAAWFVLARAWIRVLVRSQAATIGRGLLAASASGAAAALAVRNNAVVDASALAAISLGFGAFGVGIGTGSLALPAFEERASLHWLRLPEATSRVAAAATLAAFGLLFAAVHACVFAAVGSPAISPALESLAFGGISGVLSANVARLVRGDDSRLFSWCAGFAVIVAFASAMVRVGSLAVAVVLSVAAFASGEERRS